MCIRDRFTHGSLNTFAKPTNVDTDNRLICYDILDLGKQLMPIGMLVVLDSILNRITQNRAKGKQTFISVSYTHLDVYKRQEILKNICPLRTMLPSSATRKER